MNTSKTLTKRQRLIEDGYLVDLSEHAMKPLACTYSIFDILIRIDPKYSLKIDLAAIVHYVLLMSDICFESIDPTTRQFTVILNRKSHTFRLIGSTDENGEHLTITRDFLELR